MTQSQIDLTDTILHILSFASVTTDLYGHRIEFVEKIIQGPKNKNLLYHCWRDDGYYRNDWRFVHSIVVSQISAKTRLVMVRRSSISCGTWLITIFCLHTTVAQQHNVVWTKPLAR